MDRQIPNIRGCDLMFRTHNFGDLMGSVKKTELTEKQKIDLKDLLNKIELTPNQAQERDRLIKKRDSKPELDDTGKKLIQSLFNELILGIPSINYSTIQTSKGNEMETSAIIRIAKVEGWGHFINANKLNIELRDKWGIGHPDAIKKISKIGFDAKCCFTIKSFPMHSYRLDERNYIWQAKRLAMMAGFDKWYVSYSLENTPEHLIIAHAKQLWKKEDMHIKVGELFTRDFEPVGEEQKHFINAVYANHNFDHLADWERVKTFEVPLTDSDIKLIESRAKLGREYFDKLVEDHLSNKKKADPAVRVNN